MNGITYWFTGRPCSGKTTLVEEIVLASKPTTYPFHIVDGDKMRRGLCSNVDFSIGGRKENLRRVAEHVKDFNEYGPKGINVLAAFVSPTNEFREMVREIIGPEKFRLIYVRASLEICEDRDTKGMYKMARAGVIKSFTGVHEDALFEEPENPDLILDTEKYDGNIEKCVRQFYEKFSLLHLFDGK